MSATVDGNDQFPCPSYGWCNTFNPDYAAAHEHYRSTAYVPATLSPNEVSTSGATFPSVGVGISYSEHHDAAPGIFVHLSGPDHDADVLMRPDEAAALARAMQQAIEVLESTENPRLLTRDAERVRAEVEVRESLE